MGQPPHGLGCERAKFCGVSRFGLKSFSDVSLSVGQVYCNALLRNDQTVLNLKEKANSRRLNPSCF